MEHARVGVHWVEEDTGLELRGEWTWETSAYGSDVAFSPQFCLRQILTQAYLDTGPMTHLFAILSETPLSAHQERPHKATEGVFIPID